MALRVCFSSLPAELLAEIAQLATSETQLSLCAVNKTLNYIAMPLFYHSILLTSTSAVIDCASTLATSSVASKAVKQIRIIYHSAQSPSRDDLVSDNAELLSRAFTRLFNLRFLTVNVPTAERQAYEDIIWRTTFPNLEVFLWCSTISLHLLAFLSNHPKIFSVGFNFEPLENVVVIGHTVPGAEPIVMPKLSKYYGELSHIRLLGCWEALASVTVQWTGHTDFRAFEESVVALSQSKNLLEFELVYPIISIGHLGLISEHLASVRNLKINLCSVYTSEGEGNGREIQAALSRFPNLMSLTIKSPHRARSKRGKHNLDDDYKNVKVWGQLCPSLKKCTTPRNISWIRCAFEVPVPNRKQPLSMPELVEWVPSPIEGEAQVWVQNIMSKAILEPGWKSQLRAKTAEWENSVNPTREMRMEMRAKLKKEVQPDIVDILFYSDDEGDDDEEEEELQEEVPHLLQGA